MSAPSNGNGYPPALKFELGKPQVIALSYAEGKPVNSRSGDRLMFSLTDGTKWFAEPYVQDRLNAAGVTVGVPIEVTQVETRTGNRRFVDYQVRRLGTGAAQTAPAPAPPAQTPPQQSAARPMSDADAQRFMPPAQPPQLPPVPQFYPNPPPTPANGNHGPVNGAGENTAAIISRCYIQAVDVALAAVQYAEKQGLRITPEFADIRALAATMCITETGRR